MEHWKMLGIRSGNPVYRAQFANAVGGAKCGDALDAGIPVGRIGCIQLIAATNSAHFWIAANRVINGEGVVSGYSENIGDPDRPKSRKNVFNYGY
jgi:hypothetical protein